VLAAGDGDEVARRIVSTNAELAIAVMATSGYMDGIDAESTEELWERDPLTLLNLTLSH
jgi:hypothetical protein